MAAPYTYQVDDVEEVEILNNEPAFTTDQPVSTQAGSFQVSMNGRCSVSEYVRRCFMRCRVNSYCVRHSIVNSIDDAK
jgi:hypothetical protein